jgi:hypothetical protein
MLRKNDNSKDMGKMPMLRKNGNSKDMGKMPMLHLAQPLPDLLSRPGVGLLKVR